MRVAIFQGPAEPGDVPSRLELLAARARERQLPREWPDLFFRAVTHAHAAATPAAPATSAGTPPAPATPT